MHNNHMGFKKTRLLAFKSIYWIGIIAYIESHIKLFNMSRISAQGLNHYAVVYGLNCRNLKDRIVGHFDV